MSSITQNHFDENNLIDCVRRFFSRHHVGRLIARCNGMKEKGVSPVSLLRYKLSNIFVGRSMYMQQRTGSFKEDFSKNTFYRFLNSVKTNWLRFTSLLAADIVNNDLKNLTDDKRKNVFIKDTNIKEIYSRNKKRRGKSKYLLSVCVMVGKENPIPAKIVCVRNKANRKDWLAFICTDTTLSEEEIIRIYGKRWQIEVFFKTCKSMLNLIGECHSLSYDALTAHVAIVLTRYMLIAMEQRQNEDQRTLGELFFFLVDEMADITFSRSLGILMDALMASLQVILKLSDEQLTAFTADFEARLPEYLRNALHPEAVVA